MIERLAVLTMTGLLAVAAVGCGGVKPVKPDAPQAEHQKPREAGRARELVEALR